MTAEIYSKIFNSNGDKSIGDSTEDESDGDEEDGSQLDGSGPPIGTPDSAGASTVAVNGGSIDYGRGNGSASATADKNYSESRERGTSRQVGFDTNSWSFAATSIPHGRRRTDGRANYNPHEVLKDKRFFNRGEKYRKLHILNSGIRDGDRQRQECSAEYFTLVRQFAAKLGLSGHFVHEAGRMLKEYDGRTVGTENGLDKAALASLSLAQKEHFENTTAESKIGSKNRNVGEKNDGHSVTVSYSQTPFGSWKNGFGEHGFQSWDSYEEDGLNHRSQPIQQTDQFRDLMNEYGLDRAEVELSRIQRKLKNTDAYEETYLNESEHTMNETENEISESVELSFLNYAGRGEISNVEQPPSPTTFENNSSAAPA